MSLRNKRLSAKRAVTIPKDIAAYAGFVGGDNVDISVDDKGQVVIAKHLPVCRVCGDTVNARCAMGIEICPTCAAKLAEEVQN